MVFIIVLSSNIKTGIATEIMSAIEIYKKLNKKLLLVRFTAIKTNMKIKCCSSEVL